MKLPAVVFCPPLITRYTNYIWNLRIHDMSAREWQCFNWYLTYWSFLSCLLFILFYFASFYLFIYSLLSVHLDYLKDMQNESLEHEMMHEKEMKIYLPSVWCYAITALLLVSLLLTLLHVCICNIKLRSMQKEHKCSFSSLTGNQPQRSLWSAPSNAAER